MVENPALNVSRLKDFQVDEAAGWHRYAIGFENGDGEHQHVGLHSHSIALYCVIGIADAINHPTLDPGRPMNVLRDAQA